MAATEVGAVTVVLAVTAALAERQELMAALMSKTMQAAAAGAVTEVLVAMADMAEVAAAALLSES